jgi:hypothetical protein
MRFQSNWQASQEPSAQVLQGSNEAHDVLVGPVEGPHLCVGGGRCALAADVCLQLLQALPQQQVDPLGLQLEHAAVLSHHRRVQQVAVWHLALGCSRCCWPA